MCAEVVQHQTTVQHLSVFHNRQMVEMWPDDWLASSVVGKSDLDLANPS